MSATVDGAAVPVVLARFLGSEDALPRGSFVNVLERHTYAMMCTIVVSCPSCGARTTLSREHKIAEDGSVTPAIACAERCGFFELVKLDTWRQLVG